MSDVQITLVSGQDYEALYIDGERRGDEWEKSRWDKGARNVLDALRTSKGLLDGCRVEFITIDADEELMRWQHGYPERLSELRR